RARPWRSRCRRGRPTRATGPRSSKSRRRTGASNTWRSTRSGSCSSSAIGSGTTAQLGGSITATITWSRVAGRSRWRPRRIPAVFDHVIRLDLLQWAFGDLLGAATGATVGWAYGEPKFDDIDGVLV